MTAAIDIKRCAVTGSRGYLGSRVVRHFRRCGWSVVEMSRGVSPGESAIPYSLVDEIQPDALQGIGSLIHCAHDFHVRDEAAMQRVNVDGSLRLFRAAKEAGVRTIIFISSMAAFDGCKSQYGQAKLKIEQEALRQGAWVVRPGTIYGKQAGGLLGSMRKVVTKLPVVPLIGNGKYPFYLVHEEDLCKLLLVLCTNRIETAEPINAASPRPIMFVQLLKDLAAAANKRPMFIPVPWPILFGGLKIGELLGVRTGLRSDSIVSLVHQNLNPDFSLAEKMGMHFREFGVHDMQ